MSEIAQPDVTPPVPAPPAGARRTTIALAIALASLALSLLLCGVAVVFLDQVEMLPLQSEPAVASASEVEALAHVTFPPGTVFLMAVRSDGLENHVVAKFRLPRSSLDTFIRDGSFATALTPGLRSIDQSHNLGDGNTWDPEEWGTVSGLKEETPTPDGTYRTLMVGLDDANAESAGVTVYLYAARG